MNLDIGYTQCGISTHFIILAHSPASSVTIISPGFYFIQPTAFFQFSISCLLFSKSAGGD